MNCRIVFTNTAKSDLQEIALNIAEKAQDRQIAIRFVKELKEATASLETFPESGAIPKDRVLMSNSYRFITHKEYLLFYKYEKAENTIYVMAIFHGKRDYMRVMKKFV